MHLYAQEHRMTLGVSAWFGVDSRFSVDHGKLEPCLVFDKLSWGHGKIDIGWCRWWAR